MSVHICRGTNRKYRGMVRAVGCRNWIPAGPWRVNKKRAFNDAANKFMDYNYKRAAVWFIADYYDPISVVEMVKP